jgi:uncharacterized membrane protein HdeD (DUF308 family)
VNETSTAETVKANATLMTIVGVALAIVGLLALGAPLWAGTTVTLLVGCLVLAAGVGQCVFAFEARSFGRGALSFLLGGLTVVCGVVMVAHPLLNLAFLTLALAAWFMVTGVFEAIYALALRPLRGWAWTLTGAALSVLLGIMIWQQWPLSGPWAIGILIGIKMLFLGVTMVLLGSAARAAASGSH